MEAAALMFFTLCFARANGDHRKPESKVAKPGEKRRLQQTARPAPETLLINYFYCLFRTSIQSKSLRFFLLNTHISLLTSFHLSDLNPNRRMVARLLPTTDVFVHTTGFQSLLQLFVEQEMIDAKACVPFVGIAEIIPKGIDNRIRM